MVNSRKIKGVMRCTMSFIYSLHVNRAMADIKVLAIPCTASADNSMAERAWGFQDRAIGPGNSLLP
ncbi:hypothetical protein BN439_3443 [Erwinia amylovora Ea644]|nr:hypothetical protein BN439_3443 [Erwinia amylovora Ea644]